MPNEIPMLDKTLRNKLWTKVLVSPLNILTHSMV
jgi:hypothetical protein